MNDEALFDGLAEGLAEQSPERCFLRLSTNAQEHSLGLAGRFGQMATVACRIEQEREALREDLHGVASDLNRARTVYAHEPLTASPRIGCSCGLWHWVPSRRCWAKEEAGGTQTCARDLTCGTCLDELRVADGNPRGGVVEHLPGVMSSVEEFYTEVIYFGD